MVNAIMDGLFSTSVGIGRDGLELLLLWCEMRNFPSSLRNAPFSLPGAGSQQKFRARFTARFSTSTGPDGSFSCQSSPFSCHVRATDLIVKGTNDRQLKKATIHFCSVVCNHRYPSVAFLRESLKRYLYTICTF